MQYTNDIFAEIETHLNDAKNILLVTLLNNGRINQETYELYERYYGFVIRKPSLFSRYWRKIMHHEHSYMLTLIRTINLIDTKELPKENNSKQPNLTVLPTKKEDINKQE